jgi:hypothetical protein
VVRLKRKKRGRPQRLQAARTEHVGAG